MDSELDRTLNQWDEKSCAEFEEFLDSLDDEDEMRRLYEEKQWEAEHSQHELDRRENPITLGRF